MENPKKFIEEAREGVVTVEFVKIGTDELRVMPCTLNPKIANTAIIINDFDATSDNFVVWSLDKDAWRSFRVNTVKRWYKGEPIEEESQVSADRGNE
jgi:hypothetical protein